MKTNKTPSAYRQLHLRLRPLPLHSSPAHGLQTRFCIHPTPYYGFLSSGPPRPPGDPHSQQAGQIRSAQPTSLGICGAGPVLATLGMWDRVGAAPRPAWAHAWLGKQTQA